VTFVNLIIHHAVLNPLINQSCSIRYTARKSFKQFTHSELLTNLAISHSEKD